jgi:hypothetical protein
MEVGWEGLSSCDRDPEEGWAQLGPKEVSGLNPGEQSWAWDSGFQATQVLMGLASSIDSTPYEPSRVGGSNSKAG